MRAPGSSVESLAFYNVAPSSVTEVVTEEREKGSAYFRGLKIGDVSHLSMAGEQASFAARFCEVYSDMSQRH